MINSKSNSNTNCKENKKKPITVDWKWVKTKYICVLCMCHWHAHAHTHYIGFYICLIPSCWILCWRSAFHFAHDQCTFVCFHFGFSHFLAFSSIHNTVVACFYFVSVAFSNSQFMFFFVFCFCLTRVSAFFFSISIFPWMLYQVLLHNLAQELGHFLRKTIRINDFYEFFMS